MLVLCVKLEIRKHKLLIRQLQQTRSRMAPHAIYREAKQGGRHLVDPHHFNYRVVKKKPNKTYYECLKKRSIGCPAKAIVLNQSNELISWDSSLHNHDSDLVHQHVRDKENAAIQNAATDISIKPRTVLGNLTNEIQQEFLYTKLCVLF